jgi:hypothetical protein
MERQVLSDAASERMASWIIDRPDPKGYRRDNRMFVEGVLWIARNSPSPRRNKSARQLACRTQTIKMMCHYVSCFTGLGSVWIQDSHPGLIVIQAWDGPIRFN